MSDAIVNGERKERVYVDIPKQYPTRGDVIRSLMFNGQVCLKLDDHHFISLPIESEKDLVAFTEMCKVISDSYFKEKDSPTGATEKKGE